MLRSCGINELPALVVERGLQRAIVIAQQVKIFIRAFSRDAVQLTSVFIPRSARSHALIKPSNTASRKRNRSAEVLVVRKVCRCRANQWADERWPGTKAGRSGLPALIAFSVSDAASGQLSSRTARGTSPTPIGLRLVTITNVVITAPQIPETVGQQCRWNDILNSALEVVLNRRVPPWQTTKSRRNNTLQARRRAIPAGRCHHRICQKQYSRSRED